VDDKRVKALKIGRRKVKVQYKPHPTNAGTTNFYPLRVEIDPRESDDRENVDTLLHEAIHAMWDVYRWPARMSEETVAFHLGAGLTRLFLENPGLATHIEELLEATR